MSRKLSLNVDDFHITFFRDRDLWRHRLHLGDGEPLLESSEEVDGLAILVIQELVSQVDRKNQSSLMGLGTCDKVHWAMTCTVDVSQRAIRLDLAARGQFSEPAGACYAVPAEVGAETGDANTCALWRNARNGCALHSTHPVEYLPAKNLIRLEGPSGAKSAEPVTVRWHYEFTAIRES